MNAVIIIAFVLLFMRVVGFVALVLAEREPRPAPPARSVDPCLGPLPGIPPVGTPDPAAEESVLLARLRAGRIGRGRYHAAMADLARRDAGTPPYRLTRSGDPR